MTQIVVIGSGMAGYGAAHRLSAEGIRPVTYEKSTFYGGHTASFRDERGFLFDLGPHISFTKVPRMQELFAGYVDQKYESVQINLNNYWRGSWITHPVQLHLNALPRDLIIQVMSDFVKAMHEPEGRIENYEQWLYASFGKTFAETFPMTYGRKYHTTAAGNMSIDWLGPRIYRPSFEEMLRGALAPWTPELHYITNFRYPTDGGFIAYLRDLPKLADMHLGVEVTAIDPKDKSVRFKDGKTVSYDGLVSSVPLPDLLPMIKGAPRDVVEASQRLACTTCVLVNVGVARSELSKAQMSYFYDEDICFSRISFPHMLAASNVPAGCGSIQAEVYFSKKYKPLAANPDTIIEPVIRDLRRAGVLREDDEILTRHARVVNYANVIFDLERASALKIVHGYLDDIGVAYCGRYGDWGYMWTDESFMSGERAAETALTVARRS